MSISIWKSIFLYLNISFTPFIFSVENDFEKGMLTLTFDDGYACHYETAFPLLERYGLPATFYVPTVHLKQPGYLTIEQMVELSQGGHEIASHSVTHSNLKRIPAVKVDQELRESKQILENLLKLPVKNFAAPFGAFHSNQMYLLKKYYQSNRTVIPGFNPRKNLNPFMIKAYVVFNSTPLDEINCWIEEAICENKWIVLVYHRIDNSNNLVSINSCALESHLKSIQNHHIKVKTIEQALNYIY